MKIENRILISEGTMCETSVKVSGDFPCGGDAGHGGFAELVFSHNGCASWEVEVKEDGYGVHRATSFDYVEKLRFRVGGDCEVSELADVLSQAAAARKAPAQR